MILVHSHSPLVYEGICKTVEEPITLVRRREDLANEIVRHPGLAIVIVEADSLTTEWENLLDSIMNAFPQLHVGLVLPKDAIPAAGCVVKRKHRFSPVDPGRGISGKAVISRPEDPGKIDWSFLRNSRVNFPRRHQRFDWPVRGILKLDGKIKSEYSVRSISATGAFFENPGAYPGALTNIETEIRFGEFNLRTECEILAPRGGNQGVGAGFGIRFLDLTSASASMLDQMVHDALLSLILDDDSVKSEARST